MIRLINRLKVIYLICALSIMVGCTHVSKVPDYSLHSQRNDYDLEKKIDLNIALVQNEALRTAKWEVSHAGDTWLMEIGPQLAKNSNELASILFKNVTVTDISKSNSRVDAVLTPRVVTIERAYAGKDEGVITTIVFEWKLQDRDQNLIWIDTIKGNSKASLRQDEDGNRLLLQDLFRKSFQSIKSSPEINMYAEKRKE